MAGRSGGRCRRAGVARAAQPFVFRSTAKKVAGWKYVVSWKKKTGATLMISRRVHDRQLHVGTHDSPRTPGTRKLFSLRV